MSESHSEFIGDKIERSIEIIGQESEEHDEWELLNKYAVGNLDYDVMLEGDYIRVIVHER